LRFAAFCVITISLGAAEIPTRKLRRPIRLVEQSEVSAAGNYRRVPLADAPEAALSERASEVLQKQTGIQVNRAGAPGTQSLLGLRGSSPDQVEFFIEDMPLPKPYNGPLNLEAIPLPLFSSLEIYPSFVPSHLPAVNLGGALNFRLKELATSETEYLTQTTATSLQGYGIAASRLTDSSLHFVNVEGSRNRYTYANNKGTIENTTDDVILTRQNEDFSRLGYTGFYRATHEKWRVSALLDISQTERGLPGTQNLPLNSVRRSETRAVTGISAKRSLGELFSLQLFATGAFDRAQIYDRDRELISAIRSESLSPQTLAGAGVSFRTPEWDAAIYVRGKYQNVTLASEKIAERREGQGALSAAYEKNLFRLAAQSNANIGEDFAAQGAFYASSAQSYALTGFGASGIAMFRPLHLFSTDRPRASLLEIYGQISSAYRAPSLYERFGDNIFVTASETLRNERALTNSGGIKGSITCLWEFVCSWRSEAWLTGAKDYIIFTQNSARTLIAVNASSAQIWGLENELLFNLPERFLLALRYTYLDARDFGNIPFYQDKYLPQRPRHHAAVTTTFLYSNFRLINTLEYRGAVFRDRYNSYGYYLPAKIIVDLGIDYTIIGAARHTLNFTVKNLTDNRDVDLIGYAVPGRYFMARWTSQW